MPTYTDFDEPVRLMSEAVGPATDEQRQLAARVGLVLDDEPRAIAAALLEDHLQPAIRGTQPLAATDRQREFLHQLGSRHADRRDLTRTVASAWIDHMLTLQTIDHLIRLQPVRNDAVIVRKVTEFEGRRLESLDYKRISSIGDNGLLYFMGGNGQCAYPHRVVKALPSDNPVNYPQFNELSDDST